MEVASGKPEIWVFLLDEVRKARISGEMVRSGPIPLRPQFCVKPFPCFVRQIKARKTEGNAEARVAWCEESLSRTCIGDYKI